MGYSDIIGGGGRNLDDVLAARLARLVEAQQAVGCLPVGSALSARISGWIEHGGPRPWEPAPPLADTYPPEEPR
jgi:hypothetical protein